LKKVKTENKTAQETQFGAHTGIDAFPGIYLGVVLDLKLMTSPLVSTVGAKVLGALIGTLVSQKPYLGDVQRI